MTEVQPLCVSEKKLETHKMPSSSQNISFTLVSLLLNLQQRLKKNDRGNEAVAIHFSFNSTLQLEETLFFFSVCLAYDVDGCWLQ